LKSLNTCISFGFIRLLLNFTQDLAIEDEILIFIYDHSDYNQTFIIENDVLKNGFRCPSKLEIYEWLVMIFDKKNSFIYQKANNLILYSMINHNIKVYIDDIMTKSKYKSNYSDDLHSAFEHIRIQKQRKGDHEA